MKGVACRIPCYARSCDHEWILIETDTIRDNGFITITVEHCGEQASIVLSPESVALAVSAMNAASNLTLE